MQVTSEYLTIKRSHPIPLVHINKLYIYYSIFLTTEIKVILLMEKSIWAEAEDEKHWIFDDRHVSNNFML